MYENHAGDLKAYPVGRGHQANLTRTKACTPCDGTTIADRNQPKATNAFGWFFNIETFPQKALVNRSANWVHRSEG